MGSDPCTWQLSCTKSPSVTVIGVRCWSNTGGFLGSGIEKAFIFKRRSENRVKGALWCTKETNRGQIAFLPQVTVDAVVGGARRQFIPL